MKLAPFDDWFAVRESHTDEKFWPARLKYDPGKGIELESINFSGPELWYKNPTFEAETITGYIDYQRPATLIRPFIQSAGPGSIGRDTPIFRARYRVVANGLLRNFHLTDLTRRCFSALAVHLLSFHAWVAPDLVRQEWTFENGLPSPAVSVSQPIRREFIIEDGSRIEVTSYSSAAESNGAIPLTQHTRLAIRFTHPVDYETAMQVGGIAETLFDFLIGRRLESAVYFLTTTETRSWNEKEEDVVAESWVVPAFKRDTNLPDRFSRIFTESNSPVGIDRLLSACLNPTSADLIHFMNMVLAAEMYDLKLDDCFIEMLGCLEDFDRSRFGSGKDLDKRRVARKIKSIVRKYGGDEEKALCDEIGAQYRNEFPLRRRLERLTALWREDGFRGSPDIDRMVKIRNLKPHGRGREFGVEDFRFVADVLPFLSALFRYHLLKALGFERKSIAAGFIRVAHLYGMFVPEDLR
jgi:hypothetical protein